jgi:UDP-N-acetylmuramate dehydrogenase
MKEHSHISLQPYNTFGINVSTQRLIIIETQEELQDFLRENTDALQVLGGGSNILLTKDVNKTTLLIRIKGNTIVQETDDFIDITYGAGENWHEAVLFAVENNWGGMENLSLIPGTVGAAPIQNIGAYGTELKDIFVQLTACSIADGSERIFLPEDCHFGYRSSIFKHQEKGKYIITSVTVRLQKNPRINLTYKALKKAIENEFHEGSMEQLTIKDISDTVCKVRTSKLPNPETIGNSGSFFKNPEISADKVQELLIQYPSMPNFPTSQNLVKVPAAWLIEQCGWKGKRVGNTGTYKNHALVLVNHGNASGQEIHECAKAIQKSVVERFGIDLEMEVTVL